MVMLGEGPGLHATEEAPEAFQAWVEQLLNKWDFENMVTAHNGSCFVHAKVNQHLAAIIKTTPRINNIK